MPVEVRVITEGTKACERLACRYGGHDRGFYGEHADQADCASWSIPGSRILKYDEKIKGQVEMARGDQLAEEQAYLEAVKQYQAVLELNKNSSLAHYKIGDIFFKLRNYAASMEEFRRALDGDMDPRWVGGVESREAGR
jgi:tetratricopeptide (TPR) repeat protein